LYNNSYIYVVYLKSAIFSTVFLKPGRTPGSNLKIFESATKAQLEFLKLEEEKFENYQLAFFYICL